MAFSECFLSMYEGYIGQLAYENLEGAQIPEFWYGADDPRSPVAEADRAMARIRCLEFGTVFGNEFPKRTGCGLTEAMWRTSGMILAGKDRGDGVQDFSDHVQSRGGFTAETASVADGILEEFLEAERTRPQA